MITTPVMKELNSYSVMGVKFATQILSESAGKVWSRGGSRAAAKSKMECFVIIVNSFQPLTIITKRFILDIAAALDRPLGNSKLKSKIHFKVFSYQNMPEVE